MLPRVAILNHSPRYLSDIQRRLKREPLDVYLYHQVPDFVPDLVALAPALMVLSFKVGFPNNLTPMITAIQARAALRAVPLMINLVGLEKPPALPADDLIVLFTDAHLSNLDRLVTAMHEILHVQSSARA